MMKKAFLFFLCLNMTHVLLAVKIDEFSPTEDEKKMPLYQELVHHTRDLAMDRLRWAHNQKGEILSSPLLKGGVPPENFLEAKTFWELFRKNNTFCDVIDSGTSSNTNKSRHQDLNKQSGFLMATHLANLSMRINLSAFVLKCHEEFSTFETKKGQKLPTIPEDSESCTRLTLDAISSEFNKKLQFIFFNNAAYYFTYESAIFDHLTDVSDLIKQLELLKNKLKLYEAAMLLNSVWKYFGKTKDLHADVVDLKDPVTQLHVCLAKKQKAYVEQARFIVARSQARVDLESMCQMKTMPANDDRLYNMVLAVYEKLSENPAPRLDETATEEQTRDRDRFVYDALSARIGAVFDSEQNKSPQKKIFDLFSFKILTLQELLTDLFNKIKAQK